MNFFFNLTITQNIEIGKIGKLTFHSFQHSRHLSWKYGLSEGGREHFFVIQWEKPVFIKKKKHTNYACCLFRTVSMQFSFPLNCVQNYSQWDKPSRNIVNANQIWIVFALFRRINLWQMCNYNPNLIWINRFCV